MGIVSYNSLSAHIRIIPSQHISGEIVELCEVIRAHGRMTGRVSLFIHPHLTVSTK